MAIKTTTEKCFESDIEASFLSLPLASTSRGADTYDARLGLFPDTLIRFAQRTQPKAWARFKIINQVDAV